MQQEKQTLESKCTHFSTENGLAYYPFQLPIFTATLQRELKQAKATEQTFRSQVEALLKEKNAQTTINNTLVLEVENYKKECDSKLQEIARLQTLLVELRHHIQITQPQQMFPHYGSSLPPTGGS